MAPFRHHLPSMKRPKHVKPPAYLSKSPPVPKPEAVETGKPGRRRGEARPHALRRLGEEGHRDRFLGWRSIFFVARRAAEHRFQQLVDARPCRSAGRRPRRQAACRCRALWRCGEAPARYAPLRRRCGGRSSVRPRFLPSPIALPSEKLRLLVDEQVSTRSPRPDRPASVSRRPPIASPKRVISAKPRAISAARAFWPSPRPSATPQAIASTFLTAPPTSAPATSSVQ